MSSSHLTPKFVSNVEKRHRSEKIWNVIFLASTAVGIVFLALLLLNIINQAFGYVAFKTKVDPDTLAVNGVPIESQDKETLMVTLEANISKGRFRQLNREIPWEERSTENIYDLVWEEVVKPQVAQTWLLYDSLFHRDQIQAEFEAKVPKGELRFQNWIAKRC